ncbi:MAG: hypothetical protein PHX27_03240, partial [Candidatus ainarchaeum sp.]|nr:hypothetical protein [Candidatus ainarchaeum sp.]
RQTLKGSLIIDNIQTELQNQEIIITDSEKLLKITLTQTKITVSDMKPVIIDFDLTVADKTLKKAKDTKITFTLKGTTISSTFTITVHPTIPLTEFIESARETNKTILDETLKAGELKPIILTFQNKNKNITAENLLFEIVADEGYEDKLSWISMTNDNIINKIEPTKKETIQLRVTPPITSQIGDDFKGKLIIKSDSLEDKKEYIISFKVKTASNVNLVFNKNTFKTKCTSECITINTATEGMKLKNAGNADATDVKIELDPTRSNECDTDWIVELLVNSFDVISAGKDKTIEMAITPRYINNTKKTTCYFKISYTDPTKEDRQVILVDPPLIIETTYSEK